MLTLAYSLFWVNFVYGVAVKLHWLGGKRFRFLHHVLYFLVMLTLFISIAYEFFHKNFLNTSVLIFLFAMLLAMIRFSGKSPSHWKYAIVCNLFYTLTFICLR